MKSLVFVMFICVVLYSQSLVIHTKTDSVPIIVPINSIDSITFSEENNILSRENWQISAGAFTFDDRKIKAIGAGGNYIWYKNNIGNQFTLTMKVMKSEKSDFRINLLSNTNSGTYYMGKYYQILIPWEGGDSRVDYFNDGFNYHVLTGSASIKENSFSVKVQSLDNKVTVWIDNKVLMSFSVDHSSNYGYFGFAYYGGFVIDELNILGE